MKIFSAFLFLLCLANVVACFMGAVFKFAVGGYAATTQISIEQSVYDFAFWLGFIVMWQLMVVASLAWIIAKGTKLCATSVSS